MNLDPYEWMENLDNPKLLEWIEVEDRKFREYVHSLSQRLRERIRRYYFVKNLISVRISEKGYYALFQDRDVFKLKLLDREGEWIDVIDSRELGEHVILKDFYPDPTGRYLAYNYSFKGADVGFTHFIDVETGELLDKLEGIVGSIIWLDKEAYYYVRFFSKSKSPDGVDPPTTRMFLRRQQEEEMVFGEGLPQAHFILAKPSTDYKNILIAVSLGWSKSDTFVGPLKDPSRWRKIFGGDFITFPIDAVDNSYLIAAFDSGGYGRIILASVNGEVKELVREWRYPLKEAALVGDKLLIHYLVDASSILRVFDLKGKMLDEIKFDGAGTVSITDFNSSEAVLKYTSFLTPYRFYKFSGRGLEVIESKDFKLEITVEERWVESFDGTRIHMFIVKRKNCKADKVLLYGYGGFNVSITPHYLSYLIPFIEDCGTYVIANIRGGGEYGEKWHRDGMREKKENVFMDFIAAAKYLKNMGAKVVAMGSSNGGLLVGAVLTKEPELLDGAVIGYPVLDMLKFHKLYIGKSWVPEYGDPDNPKDAEFLIKYSPYHNVKPAKYPPTLVYTGLHDDRVHPAHAFKFVAKLKEVNAPVYLRVEKASGHSGATPKIKLNELSDILAFIYKVLGLSMA